MIIFRSYSGFYIEGGKATILGWGNTRDKGDQSCDLLKANTKVTPAKHFICHVIVQVDVQNGRCPMISLSIGNPNDTQICVHHEDQPPAQVCNGDSGGPLMIQTGGDQSRWFLSGVVSFGTNECDSSLPGVYTDITAFYHWIQDITQNTHGL